MKLRKIALTLHSYVGVFVGLVLIVICVTGSLLVFQEELERFFHPHLLQVIPQGKPVALESVRRTVQAAYPDLKLHQIVLPKHDKPRLFDTPSSLAKPTRKTLLTKATTKDRVPSFKLS